MFRNYLKIAIRTFIRNWSISLLNITGLAVGMAAAILIFLWVIDERSVDLYHENLDELYRVYEKQEYAGQDPLLVYNTPGPLAPAFAETFPEFKRVARFSPVWQQLVFRKDDKLFHETEGYFADQQIFEMFTFHFLYGHPDNALSSPGAIILTAEMAEKYFGAGDPTGRAININNEHEFVVTGVLNRQANSHFRYDFIIPFETNAERLWGPTVNSWNSNSFFTYVQIGPETDYKETEMKITDFMRDHQLQTSLHLEPFKRSHLHNIWGSGAIHNIRIFTIVALLILLIACVNFMNLSTARSAKRSREVGLRKVVGGTRSQIATQFLGESVLFSLFALMIALVLVEILIPGFNQLTGKELAINILSPFIIAGLFLIAFITGIISGSYPALFLSSFRPVNVLKGQLVSGSKSFRRALVVFQFALSVALIISTLTIGRQMNYIRNKQLGYQKENIVTLYTSASTAGSIGLLMKELESVPGIQTVSASNNSPSRIGNSTYGINWEGKDPDERVLFNFLHTDFGLIETFGMEMHSGRSFSREFTSDSSAYVINEEAARFIGGEVIGKPFNMWGIDGEVIGVVKDFHFQNLRQKITPLVIRISPPLANLVHLRLYPSNINATMDEIKGVWKRVCPDEPINYQFFDQQFDRMYRAEQRTSRLFVWFSILALAISCLGLFGLASYMAEQKTREISVRKVFGAGSVQVTILMVTEFFKWVVAAILIGMPVAWYFMDSWLDNFAYRAGQGFFPYFIASVAAMGIALLTVAYQALRTALSNPAASLRNE
jgi:putative ABC transport system permease protein